MHQKRQQSSKKLPIPRKGTKYVARASSHINNSVSVVIALRDMLGLAHTSREVKRMINQKSIKINDKLVQDHRESIKLFNILEAKKPYILTILPTKKFAFEETKKKERLCKVVGKKLLKEKKIQLNFHDGSNILTKEKNIKTGDSIYLDFFGKITKHIPLEKGKQVFIISGKYAGLKGKIDAIQDRKLTISFKEKTAILGKNQIIML